MIDSFIHRLVIELETGGNLRFEEGKTSDPWSVLWMLKCEHKETTFKIAATGALFLVG